MVMKQLLLAFGATVLWSWVASAQSPDFEYYNLSLIWPASFCAPSPKNCISPIPKMFTISGVWPTLKNGTALPPYDPVDNNCNYSPAAPADMATALKPIHARLQKTWPNLINGATNELFWEVVWANQGMCSDYPQDPLAYFTSALNLAENTKYDPLKVLGVAPSKTPYPIETLLENVKKKVGFYPQISCSMPIRGTKQLYLQEIRFCFKRAMPPSALQNCPDHMDDMCRSVPPAQRNVMFPLPTPSLDHRNIMSSLASSSTSWPGLTCGSLLVSVQWGIIGLLVLYILARRNRVHEHVE